MKKIFSFKKKKETPPPVSVEEAAERINRRGDKVEEKIKALDAELLGYKEQIKKTKPGPTQDALKARALRVLKQKKMYEGQRDMLYNQSFKLERVSFAAEGIKDAQQTMVAMKAGNKELEGTLKVLNIDDVDKLQDEISNIVDASDEMQDSLVQGHDNLDEDDLLGELDEIEADVKTEKRAAVTARIQPDKEIAQGDQNLPPAPLGHTTGPQPMPQAADESGA